MLYLQNSDGNVLSTDHLLRTISILQDITALISLPLISGLEFDHWPVQADPAWASGSCDLLAI